MATPFVAGAAAVLQGREGNALPPEEVRAIICTHANLASGPESGDSFAVGSGVLSVHNFMLRRRGLKAANWASSPRRLLAGVAAAAVVGAALWLSAPWIQRQVSNGAGETATAGPSSSEGAVAGQTARREWRHAVTGRAEAAWVRSSCYEYSPSARTLVLRVYRGMTLSDLGMHFGVTDADIKRENPHIAGTRLEAGEEYGIPLRGLTLERHRVRRGETLGGLTARYDLPTLYTIRTLNCLPSVRIEAGDELLVYRRTGVHPDGAEARRVTERPGFSSPPDSRWAHAGVYDYDPSSGLLRLQVFRGMTLSDIALHFRQSPDDIEALNPSLRGGRILAGQRYLDPHGAPEGVALPGQARGHDREPVSDVSRPDTLQHPDVERTAIEHTPARAGTHRVRGGQLERLMASWPDEGCGRDDERTWRDMGIRTSDTRGWWPGSGARDSASWILEECGRPAGGSMASRAHDEGEALACCLRQAYGLRSVAFEAALLMLEDVLPPAARPLLESLPLSSGSFGDLVQRQRLASLTLADCALVRKRLDEQCLAHPRLAVRRFEQSAKRMGLPAFATACEHLLRSPAPSSFVVVSSSRLAPVAREGLSRCGLGERQLRTVGLDEAGRLDTRALRSALLDSTSPLLAVVVEASSLDGAVDPIDQILEIRAEYWQDRGRDFWLHIHASDALAWQVSRALSGRPVEDSQPCAVAEFDRAAVDSLSLDARDFGLPGVAGWVYLHGDPTAAAGKSVAPRFNETHSPVHDTETPAAETLRRRAGRAVQLARQAHGAFSTIQGQPGSAPAVMWRLLRPELESSRFVVAPAAPRGTAPPTIAAMNRAILQALSKRAGQPGLSLEVAAATLGVEEYGLDVLYAYLATLGWRGRLAEPRAMRVRGNPWRDADHVTALVIASSGAGAERPGDSRAGDTARFAEELANLLGAAVASVLEEPIPSWLRPELTAPVLVLEDRSDTLEALARQLEEISFTGAGRVMRAGSLDAARRFMEAAAPRLALVDIEIGEDPAGGLKFLEFARSRREFKGAVVFTVHEDVQGEVEKIAADRPDWVVTFHAKPRQLSQDPSLFQREANLLVEDVWDILQLL